MGIGAPQSQFGHGHETGQISSCPCHNTVVSSSWICKGMMDKVNHRCGGLYKIGFVQGPQKLNDGSMKMIHSETKD
jgi:hypothetical protein